jgi:predicted GNAT superfamily acetyltransferase
MNVQSDPAPIASEIVYRRASSLADYRACQEAQRSAWGIVDDGYLIPIASMVGANLHGGMVLGAFMPSGQAAAMSFAFLGRVESRLCLYSQLTGVIPEYQSRGIGNQLKQFQRELARREEIPRIAWAFDPLQAGNAYFNLSRLGAVATRFIPDMYGKRTDSLSAGAAATDRLIVEWDTDERTQPPVIDDSALTHVPSLLKMNSPEPGSEPAPMAVNTSIDAPTLLLEIPDSIARLRREQPVIAEQWRDAVRQAFTWAFNSGYTAHALWRHHDSTRRRAFYVLSRQTD